MLDSNGFKRKTYDELLTELINKAQEVFGSDVNIGERSVIGRIIRVIAWFMSLMWQVLEGIYNSGFISTAEGVQLDKLISLAGTRRIQAQYAYGQVTITGTPNFTVPSGFIVSTQSDILFQTTSDLTLDSNGQGTVDIAALEIGSGSNVSAGSINVIENPIADVISVVNEFATMGGRETETDEELRQRSDTTVEGQGTGTVASIVSNLLQIPDVRAAYVIENDSLDIDQYGTPAKAIQPLVLGGSDDSVANAIFDKKAAGIQSYGTTNVQINDVGGFPHNIGFSRASEVNVYIQVNVKKDNQYPSDGDDQVRDSIIRYIGGDLTNQTVSLGLSLNQDVITTKIESRVLTIPGTLDVEVLTSTDNINFDANNVAISITEVAQTNPSLIEVNYIV